MSRGAYNHPMKETSVTKVLRMLDLIIVLRQGWFTKRELANRYGVSLRTIERDLSDLDKLPMRMPLTDNDGVPRRYHIVSANRWET